MEVYSLASTPKTSKPLLYCWHHFCEMWVYLYSSLGLPAYYFFCNFFHLSLSLWYLYQTSRALHLWVSGIFMHDCVPPPPSYNMNNTNTLFYCSSMVLCHTECDSFSYHVLHRKIQLLPHQILSLIPFFVVFILFKKGGEGGGVQYFPLKLTHESYDVGWWWIEWLLDCSYHLVMQGFKQSNAYHCNWISVIKTLLNFYCN